MKLFKPFLVFVIPLFVLACAGVEGYDELEETLTPQELARKEAVDAMQDWYEPVQIVFAQAVVNPNIPPDLKKAVQDADKVATEALAAYVQAANAGADDITSKLTAFIAALTKAQEILLRVRTGGFA